MDELYSRDVLDLVTFRVFSQGDFIQDSLRKKDFRDDSTDVSMFDSSL